MVICAVESVRNNRFNLKGLSHVAAATVMNYKLQCSNPNTPLRPIPPEHSSRPLQLIGLRDTKLLKICIHEFLLVIW